jgi:lipoprotein NlpD
MVCVALLAGCASGSHFDQWGSQSRAEAVQGIPESGATQRVRAGDTLYSIALAHDLDWQALARWNDIKDPRSLRAGQVLRLTPPGGDQTAARKKQNAPTAPQSGLHLAAPRAPTVSVVTESPAPSRAPPSRTVNQASAVNPSGWQWPVQGKVLSRFIDGNNLQKGLILAGALGEPVHASAAGEVVYAGNGLPGYGNLLIIKHDAEWLTAYGYNQSLLVKEGQMVTAGQTVATMGRRDDKALDKTGSLLFQIRRYGKPVDPIPLLSPR